MILAILQARASSTRLPGKVLLPLVGQPMLLRQIERTRRATSLDRIVVATSVDASDDPLAALNFTMIVELKGMLGQLVTSTRTFHCTAAGDGNWAMA